MMNAIEKFLLETIGLDSESIGNNTIRRMVDQRMLAAGVCDLNAYLGKLQKDPRELQDLIDAVTVPETWFFRDKEPFQMLASLVRSKWFPPSKIKPLRVLSLPCATGEEPYSIAMVLKTLGYSEDTLRIDAVDISLRALERAQQAVYGPNSFRGDEGEFKANYFKKTKGGFTLDDGVKKMVSFRHGNLLNDLFLSGPALYEIVFCRNVLIYFSREQQEKAITKLHRLLVNEGVLFVGHAEGGRLLGDYFTSLKQAGTFAFQRHEMTGNGAALGAPQKVRGTKSKFRAKFDVVRSAASGGRSTHPETKLTREAQTELQSISTKVEDESTGLEEVRKLADQGRLELAAEMCEQFLAENSVSAEGYYLLGLIRQAEGKDGLAAELFRKAVYLDAQHYQALVQLAVQSECVGNVAAAAVYRARASRVLGKK